MLTGFNAFAADDVATLKARIADLETQVATYAAERAQITKNLETFDKFDLEAFNRRDMKRIGEIHADNVIVHNLDGTQTSLFRRIRKNCSSSSIRSSSRSRSALWDSATANGLRGSVSPKAGGLNL